MAANGKTPAPVAKPARAILATDFFTVDELRCIHRDLFKLPWQSRVFYDERRAIVAKLDRYFGDERDHLKQGKDL